MYFKFLEKYAPSGFKEIDQTDELMLELNQFMEQNNQFFYIADLIKMDVLFTSEQSTEMIGVKPEELDFYYFMEATHPDDLQRLNLGRTCLVKMGQELFIEEKGASMLSTTFKIKKVDGKYSKYMIQCYLYYTDSPYKTVFFLKIHTNIDWCKKIKHGYHHYKGNDMSLFRFPDKELVNIGNVFSKREFEIIKLIAKGHCSEEIAKTLHISLFTVNTHRGNILKKTNKEHISDLIYELMENGLL